MLDTRAIVKEIMKSGKVFSLDDYEERLAYAVFISACVEKTLYDILTDEGAIDLSRDEFHEYVGSSAGIMAAGREVLIEAVDNFDNDSYFNFIDPAPVLPDDYEDEDIDEDDASQEVDREQVYRGYAFLPHDRAVGLVDKLFFNAEVLFYLQQLNSGKTYTWEEFPEEMEADRDMWHRLVLAFRDAVMRIDYAPYWHKFVDSIIDGNTVGGDLDE